MRSTIRNEIEELETKLNEERTRYGEMTKKGGNQAAYIPSFQVSLSNVDPATAALPAFIVKFRSTIRSNSHRNITPIR